MEITWAKFSSDHWRLLLSKQVFGNTTFHVMGGIMAFNLTNNVLRFEGTLEYSADLKVWPRQPGNGHVLECMHFVAGKPRYPDFFGMIKR